MKERTGTRSRAPSLAPQESQADRPPSALRPLGQRIRTVARKLPAIAPSKAPTATPILGSASQIVRLSRMPATTAP